MISLCADVDGLSMEFGGPIGELSSNTSPDTRNLIDSPISMYKSCVSPSSNGYSQTHACSASSNLEGCCRAVGGIRTSSKKPSVTTEIKNNVEKFQHKRVSFFWAKQTMYTFTATTANFAGYNITNPRAKDNIPKPNFCVWCTISWQNYRISNFNNVLKSNAKSNIKQNLIKFRLFRFNFCINFLLTLLANLRFISSLTASTNFMWNISGGIRIVSFNSANTNIISISRQNWNRPLILLNQIYFYLGIIGVEEKFFLWFSQYFIKLKRFFCWIKINLEFLFHWSISISKINNNLNDKILEKQNNCAHSISCQHSMSHYLVISVKHTYW